MNDRPHDKRRRCSSEGLLNRIAMIEQYSLANYLMYARPWTPDCEQALFNRVQAIAMAQQAGAARIERLLVHRYGHADSGQFPAEFTAYNDVAFDYVVRRLIRYQEAIVEAVSYCASRLRRDPPARKLALKILASEDRHRLLLASLLSPPVCSDGRSIATFATRRHARDRTRGSRVDELRSRGPRSAMPRRSSVRRPSVDRVDSSAAE